MQSQGRSAVRVAQLERTLEGFNREIGVKVAESMHRYHTEYVTPLEERVLLLETILGIRLMRWLSRQFWMLWYAVSDRLSRSNEGPETAEDP